MKLSVDLADLGRYAYLERGSVGRVPPGDWQSGRDRESAVEQLMPFVHERRL